MKNTVQYVFLSLYFVSPLPRIGRYRGGNDLRVEECVRLRLEQESQQSGRLEQSHLEAD